MIVKAKETKTKKREMNNVQLLELLNIELLVILKTTME